MQNGNGFITANELQTVLNSVGRQVSNADAKHMIGKADTNGDGQVDYEEFVRMMLARK